MSLLLPLTTDSLSAPAPGVSGKDHAFMHRVLAVDSGAPEQSLTIDSSGNATILNGLVTPAVLAYSATTQPYLYAYAQNNLTIGAQIYHNGSYLIFNIFDSVGSGYDAIFQNSTGKNMIFKNPIVMADVVQSGTTPSIAWHYSLATTGLGSGSYSVYHVLVQKNQTVLATCNAYFADMVGNYTWAYHANLNGSGTNQWGYVVGIHGANGIGILSKVDVATGINAAHYNYNMTAATNMMEFRAEEDPLNAGTYAGAFTGKFVNFMVRGVSKASIDYLGVATVTKVKFGASGQGLYDNNNKAQLLFNTTASAVNWVEITNSATGNGVAIKSAGSDSNPNFTIGCQGTGSIVLANTTVLSGSILAPLTASASTLGTTGFEWGNFYIIGNIVLDTSTGMKIGTGTTQKLSFWNKTTIAQPTTGITGATRVGGGGTTVTTTDTFGGYTIAQIAAALINVGLLA